MAYEERRAKSLQTLLNQLTLEFPRRSKASDGWIGDKAHRERQSDHNPDPKTGIVYASDFTNDPANGLSSRALAEALVASRDPRIAYIISNSEIVSGSDGPSPWKWRKYKGSNPHTKHVHISVKVSNGDDPARWHFETAAPTKDEKAKAEKEIIRPMLKVGSKGDFVKEAQRALIRKGYDLGPRRDDGDFGGLTDTAVRAFQKSEGLLADGKIGGYTWDALLS